MVESRSDLRAFDLHSAGSSLVAEQLLFQHLLEEVWQFVVGALVLHIFAEVGDHAAEYVQPHKINRCAERRRFLFQPPLEVSVGTSSIVRSISRMMRKTFISGKCADIAENFASVFGRDTSLPQRGIPQKCAAVSMAAGSSLRRNNFQQAHIARRIEEGVPVQWRRKSTPKPWAMLATGGVSAGVGGD